MEKKEKDEKRTSTIQHIENLRGLFEEQKLGLDTTWEQCCQMFAGDVIFKNTDDYERITAFIEYMKKANEAYYAERKKIRRYHERKNREMFREMLEEKFHQGQFNIKTKWNKFVVQVKDDPRYQNMLGQLGSTPRELFEEFIASEKEIFKQQKGTLKQIIKTGTIELRSSMTFEEFDEKFGKYPDYSKIEEKNRRFLHEYVVAKVKEKEQETIKKYTKDLKKYESFVKSLEGISKSSKYDDFKDIINEKRKFKALTEADKRHIFYDHALRIDERQHSISEEPGAIEKPKKDKKKARKHKTSSRCSSDHDRKKKRRNTSEEHEHRKKSKHREKDRRSRDSSSSVRRHRSRDESRERGKNNDKRKNREKSKERMTDTK